MKSYEFLVVYVLPVFLIILIIFSLFILKISFANVPEIMDESHYAVFGVGFGSMLLLFSYAGLFTYIDYLRSFRETQKQ